MNSHILRSALNGESEGQAVHFNEEILKSGVSWGHFIQFVPFEKGLVVGQLLTSIAAVEFARTSFE